MRPVRTAIKACLHAFSKAASRIIPKDDRVVFHGSTLSAYNESSRYLYEHFAGKKDGRAVWATTSPEIHAYLKGRGLRVVRHRSLEGYWNYLRAGAVVGTGISYPDLLGAVGKKTLKVCLWHGVGPRSTNSPDGKVFTSGFEIAGRVNRFDYICMTSRFTSAMIARLQFLMPERKVVVNGFPRCDHLLRSAEMEKRLQGKVLCRRYFPQIGEKDRVALYSPTWRTDQGVSFPIKAIPGFDLASLDAFLASKGVYLVVSRHPIVRGSENFENCKRIFYGPADPLFDINQVLPEVSVLLTDYSSLMTDFALINRPVAFVMPDYDEFLYGRGLLEDFRENLPGREAGTMDELLGVLSGYLDDPALDTGLRKKFLSKYYDTSITDSCERNFNLIDHALGRG